MQLYNSCPTCGFWAGWIGPDTLQKPCPLCKTDLTLHSLEYITRELWEELHMMEDPTPEQFEEWQSRVPSFGCNCQHHLRNFIDMHPVDYDNFSEWAVALHNHINRCIGKPKWEESSTPEPEPSSESVATEDVAISPPNDTAKSTESSETSEESPQPTTPKSEKSSSTPTLGDLSDS